MQVLADCIGKQVQWVQSFLLVVSDGGEFKAYVFYFFFH